MSSSKSASSSSSETKSVNEDNRVVGEGGSVVLGKEAGIVINQEFGDNVLSGFKELVGLARDAGQVVIDTTKQSNLNAQSTVSAVTSAIQQDKLGTSSVFTNMVPIIIGAVVIVIVVSMITSRK